MSSKSKNEQAYDRWAATYDTGLNSTVAVDDLAFPLMWKHLWKMRVLEIGSGTGRHTVRLAEQQNQVVGIDLSDGMLEVARSRLQGKAVRLIHGDILALEREAICDEQLFEAAVSALVLEHISELELFFKKIASLLIPHAQFFISEIHPARARAGRLAHFVDETSGDEVWLESRAHDEVVIARTAQENGFEMLQCLDARGTEDLVLKNPTWRKYVGVPIVKMWEFRRTD